MKNIAIILGSLGAGAAIMYLLDPEKGNRRRSMIADKATGLKNEAKDALYGKAKDLENRAKGMLHEAKSAVGADKQESQQTAV